MVRKSLAFERAGSSPASPTRNNMTTIDEKANIILMSLLGSSSLVEKWWLSPNRAFDYEIPDDLWHTTSGRNRVYRYLLDQMEAPY